MSLHLSITGPMPLSWCEEGPRGKAGYRNPPMMVGRRVWGEDIGLAVWVIKGCADTSRLGLFAREADGTEHLFQAFAPPEGFDSRWHSDCVGRAVRSAQRVEGDLFNRSLERVTVLGNELGEDLVRRGVSQ